MGPHEVLEKARSPTGLLTVQMLGCDKAAIWMGAGFCTRNSQNGDFGDGLLFSTLCWVRTIGHH